MNLKLNEEVLEQNRQTENEMIWQQYIHLKKQARHYKTYYEEQLDAIKIRYGKMKEDIRKGKTTLIVFFILGVIITFFRLHARFQFLIAALGLFSGLFYTIVVVSGTQLILRLLTYSVMSAPSGDPSKRITMEDEKRHCEKYIAEIEKRTTASKVPGEITQEDLDILTRLGMYQELRADTRLFKQLPDEIILVLVTVVFLFFYICV